MAVSEAEVVDAIGIDPLTSKVLLAISDHLPWTDSEHFRALERKLGAYVNFVVSGQLVADYPRAKDRRVEIQLIHEHEPTPDAINFLLGARESLKEYGISLTFGGLPPDY